MLPPALEAFSRLPIWNALFFLLAVVVVLYSGWSLGRRRRRQDLLYLLLGLYLMVAQLPTLSPPLGHALGLDLSKAEFPLRFALALPALVLFILGVRAR